MNCSTSITNIVAPPTVTSSGSPIWEPALKNSDIGDATSSLLVLQMFVITSRAFCRRSSSTPMRSVEFSDLRNPPLVESLVTLKSFSIREILSLWTSSLCTMAIISFDICEPSFGCCNLARCRTLQLAQLVPLYLLKWLDSPHFGYIYSIKLCITYTKNERRILCQFQLNN